MSEGVAEEGAAVPSSREGIDVYPVVPARDPPEMPGIRDLLRRCDLDLDEGVEVFVVCALGGRVVACAGLDRNVVKCVAIEPEHQGESLSLPLITEVTNLAFERGHAHLFMYTKPSNAEVFRHCGFYDLVEYPGRVTLMENTPIGLSEYCASLGALRRPGRRIAGIVMNANPFTRGHRYLAEHAARECDWLHVFVVGEDASQFPYEDRLAMVQAGLRDLPKTTVHPGSEYIISRATFPAYFIKEKGLVGECSTALDLLLFRRFIAPSLGITHRFVGTEPFCDTTGKYNEDMKHWLPVERADCPRIEVVEVPRLAIGDRAVSASDVRRLLARGDFRALSAIVPDTTLEVLRRMQRRHGTAVEAQSA
jgi:[citrate (pro-3S)-lyase] ligase